MTHRDAKGRFRAQNRSDRIAWEREYTREYFTENDVAERARQVDQAVLFNHIRQAWKAQDA